MNVKQISADEIKEDPSNMAEVSAESSDNADSDSKAIPEMPGHPKKIKTGKPGR